MKKWIALMLVLALVLSVSACGRKPAEEPVEDAPVEEIPMEEAPVEDAPVEDAPAEDAPAEDAPAPAADNDASALLNAVWALYGEDEKFPLMGGNPEAGIMDAPGVFDLAYTDALASFLQLTAEDLANVDQAATMIHMMNANTFTAGALHLIEGTDAAALAQSIRDNVQSAQWICGFPELLLIAVVDGQIVMAYGAADLVPTFEAHLTSAYPDAEILFNEAIAG